MLTTLLFASEIKFVLKIESNVWGISQLLYYKTNRVAMTVLCSVVKHLESGYVSCFSPHFYRALAASCVLHNRSEHSLLIKLYYQSNELLLSIKLFLYLLIKLMKKMN